jgi:hypothetical protein
VRCGASAAKRTSTLLVFFGPVSTCHCGLMSQPSTTRFGGAYPENPHASRSVRGQANRFELDMEMTVEFVRVGRDSR